jgi:tRNA threonylcarbamoyladenosine biosynthesis protein TsaB
VAGAQRSGCGIRFYLVVILALDTTTRAGSVAVLDDDTVVSSVPGDGSLTHGERLPAEIARAVDQAGLNLHAIQLIAVASGPGAFTGLRIGLAAAQGLAMVLNLPVIGVSSLDALAFATWPQVVQPKLTTLWAWMDAQRGEVFAARYEPRRDGADDWAPKDLPVVGEPAQLLPLIDTSGSGPIVIVGDGALKHRQAIEAWSNGAWQVVEAPAMLASAIGMLGHRLATRGFAGAPHALQPLYVRRPDAELERERRTTP